ncbi:MAG TPA: amino acid permease [Fimbriimonadaceae bacterium]|nr:amino acid permease [Fimbriimonadaceae bacterium]
MSNQPHLVRQIGLWSGVAVVVGSTIGSGIFKSPSGIATQLPGPLPMLAVWIVAGLIVLCGALTLAEVGSAYPYSGGIYVYVREAYGRTVGFLFGWAQLVLLRPSSIGAVAVVFGQYFLRLFGINEEHPDFAVLTAAAAIGAIATVGAANYVGVRFGTLIQNLTTVAKVAGLLVLVGLAYALALPNASAHFSPAVPPGSFSMSAFGLALVSVLWAYDGWADGSYVSGEMVDPKRNVPKAIVLGTIGIIAIYLLANVAYLAVFSVQEMAESQIIAADAMARLVGTGGVTIIIATVMLSTFGTLNGSVLTSPRVFFALAEDKMFFEPLARVHPRFNTPHVSVLLTATLGVIYVIAATIMRGSQAFTALTDAFVIGMVPFYALAVGAIFVFRKRHSGESANLEDDSLIDPITSGAEHVHRYRPSVRAVLFPITPIIFIGSTLYLLINALWDDASRLPTLITLGILLTGIPIFWVAFGKKAT